MPSTLISLAMLIGLPNNAGDAAPCHTMQHAKDRVLLNAVQIRNFALVMAIRVQLNYLRNVFWLKHAAVRTQRMQSQSVIRVPLFPEHVTQVIRLRTHPEMPIAREYLSMRFVRTNLIVANTERHVADVVCLESIGNVVSQGISQGEPVNRIQLALPANVDVASLTERRVSPEPVFATAIRTSDQTFSERGILRLHRESLLPVSRRRRTDTPRVALSLSHVHHGYGSEAT